MNIDFNLFMNDHVRKARQEIVDAGYTELKTPEEVDEALNKKGTTLSDDKFCLWLCGRDSKTSCSSGCSL